jgi:hypothetical protein
VPPVTRTGAAMIASLSHPSAVEGHVHETPGSMGM